MVFNGKIETPIGSVYAQIQDEKIKKLGFNPLPLSTEEEPETFIQLRLQLKEYFEGKRTVFDLPLAPEGTPFQKKVLKAMYQVPYGTTVSYSDLAAMAGNPKAVRATASVCPKNPIFIIIPCHRIIKKDGTIGQYASGKEIKERLLNLEKSVIKNSGEKNE